MASPTVAPTITVVNVDDFGPGSLRQAILDATGGEVIRFDPSITGQTIELSTGQLMIDKSVTIEGPAAGGITISGGHVWRVFYVGMNNDVVLRNLTVINGLGDEGGGIRNFGTLLVDHSTVAFNEAVGGSITSKIRGAGIYSVDATGPLTLVNSTVSGNAGGTGAGLWTNGTLSIRNSTITGNSGYGPGGVYSQGTVILRNSIIAGNIDNSSAVSPHPNCSFDQAIVVYAGTNMSNDATCGTDPAMLIADPLLDPLASNGGPTRTHALRAGSPAVDAGTSCSEADDQRYVARTQGTSCDLGAFEFDRYERLTLALAPNGTVNAKSGVAVVTGTVTCSSPTAVTVNVALNQTQRVTGKSTTIVQASGAATVNCVGTSSWSATLTPQTGKFAGGDAAGTAQTAAVPGFIPSAVAGSVRLFSSPK